MPSLLLHCSAWCGIARGSMVQQLYTHSHSQPGAVAGLVVFSSPSLLSASSHPRLDQAKGDLEVIFLLPPQTGPARLGWDGIMIPIQIAQIAYRPIHRSSAPPSPSARSCPPCNPSSRHTLDTRTMHNHHLQSLRHIHRMSTTEHAVIRTGALYWPVNA